ncbi:MAG: hypothetical protein ABI790_07720 [Betaproteobacteria bacterium]
MKSTFSFAHKALALAVAAGIAGSASAAVTDRVYFSAAPLVLVWGTDATGNPAVVSDFVLVNTASGTAGTDLTAASVIPVITGSMTAVPTAPSGNSLYAITNPAAAPAGGGVLTDAGTAGQLDAADTYTAFGLGATTNIGFSAGPQSHSFYVASNTGFDIFAQTGAVAYTGNFNAGSVPLTAITWSMSLSTAATTDAGVSWGGAAAQNPTGAGTGILAATSLNAFAAPTKVFDGTQRTALAAGTILAQSVRFSVQYGLNYNLSMGAGSVSVPVTYTVYTP